MSQGQLVLIGPDLLALNGSPLPCGGCVHADPSVEWPGKHGQDRACFFCIRNPAREKWQAHAIAQTGAPIFEWVDGTPPIKYPMDCYHAQDVAAQFNYELNWMAQKWSERRRGVRG